MRKFGYAAAVFLPLLAGGYWWAIDSAEEAADKWPVDVAELRRLAHTIPGDLPTEVRVEKVTGFEFPSNAIVAGTGWESRAMSCYSYQLVFPTRTALVDTAMDEATARSELSVKEYDTAAWSRVLSAIAAADFVVVTHEHYDHLGGLVKDEKAFARALLTPEQLAHPENLKPLKYPTALPKPLEYSGQRAVAPGVVLVKTPGHTPGSQLVYVQRADGAEMLFLGDVAWMAENVERVRERPRLVTMLMKEDRAAVLAQLQTLHDLHESEPHISLIPGHDGAVVDGLIARGILNQGFGGSN